MNKTKLATIWMQPDEYESWRADAASHHMKFSNYVRLLLDLNHGKSIKDIASGSKYEIR